MTLPSIRNITSAELLALDPSLDSPTIAAVGEVDGKPIAIGGISWRFDRCWLWYRIIEREGDIGHAHLVVGAAKRMLRRATEQLGETQVYAWRDETEPASKRLLEVLGFKYQGREDVVMTDGTAQDREVWLWRTR